MAPRRRIWRAGGGREGAARWGRGARAARVLDGGAEGRPAGGGGGPGQQGVAAKHTAGGRWPGAAAGAAAGVGRLGAARAVVGWAARRRLGRPTVPCAPGAPPQCGRRRRSQGRGARRLGEFGWGRGSRTGDGQRPLGRPRRRPSRARAQPAATAAWTAAARAPPAPCPSAAPGRLPAYGLHPRGAARFGRCPDAPAAPLPHWGAQGHARRRHCGPRTLRRRARRAPPRGGTASGRMAPAIAPTGSGSGPPLPLLRPRADRGAVTLHWQCARRAPWRRAGALRQRRAYSWP